MEVSSTFIRDAHTAKIDNGSSGTRPGAKNVLPPKNVLLVFMIALMALLSQMNTLAPTRSSSTGSSLIVSQNVPIQRDNSSTWHDNLSTKKDGSFSNDDDSLARHDDSSTQQDDSSTKTRGRYSSREEGSSRFPPPRLVVSDTEEFVEKWKKSHDERYPQVLALSNDVSLHEPRNKDHVASRMLVGIFTGVSSHSRREIVRQTSLNFHKDMEGYKGRRVLTSSYYRVCPLHEILTNQTTLEICLLTYVFVAAGGNESDPTMRLHYSNETPMLLPNPPECENEKDVIVLNIKENMNEGKSPTWFHYASTYLAEEEGLHFDYIAKMDDDTLLYTGNWIDFLERELPQPEKLNEEGLVYGGKINYAKIDWVKLCSQGFWACPLIGPLWMIGPFYFLSHSLAAYTSSDAIDQESLARYEDVATGSYVYSHPGNTTIVKIPRKAVFLHKDVAYDYQWHMNNFRFQGVVFAHSENACWATFGPYFKRRGNVFKVWRQYIAFRWNNQEKAWIFSDLYHLAEQPSLDNGEDPRNIHVHALDYIYSNDDFDASPIVLGEPFNLVFFPVSGAGDVVWRCLFRRLLGYKDWDKPSHQFDGLTYLSNYSIHEASVIMSSPNYTRAMFVRHPLDRIQSNYIALAEHDPKLDMLQGCACSVECEFDPDDIQKRCSPFIQDFDAFIHRLKTSCDHPSWRPQHQKMEPKYYKTLNYVGYYEDFAKDAAGFLRKALTNASMPSWVNQNNLQAVFDRIDVSYDPASYPHRFPNGGVAFGKSFWETASSSDIFKRYRRQWTEPGI